MRRYIILLIVAGAVFWIVREHETASTLIDRMTSPLFHSHAAVDESEHNRVVADAAPAVTDDQDVRLGMLKEGATAAEVRQLLGEPDSITPIVQDGKRQVRWGYPRLRRVLVLENNRVVSVAIQ